MEKRIKMKKVKMKKIYNKLIVKNNRWGNEINMRYLKQRLKCKISFLTSKLLYTNHNYN